MKQRTPSLLIVGATVALVGLLALFISRTGVVANDHVESVASATPIIRITPMLDNGNNLGMCGNLSEQEVNISNKFQVEALGTVLKAHDIDIDSIYPAASITVGSCRFVQLVPNVPVPDANGRGSYWVAVLTESLGGLSYFGMFEVSTNLMGGDIVDKID